MSDEVRRIQRMIDEGKVTSEEGAELIESLRSKPPEPPPLPETVPAPASPAEARPEWIVWPLVSHGILLAAIVLTLTVVTPKFREIFASFGAQLPWVMVLIFRLSAMATKWFLLFVPALGAFLGGDVAVYVLLRRYGSRGYATLWWWGVSLVLIGVFMAIVLALFFAHIPLMTSVGNAAGR